MELKTGSHRANWIFSSSRLLHYFQLTSSSQGHHRGLDRQDQGLTLTLQNIMWQQQQRCAAVLPSWNYQHRCMILENKLKLKWQMTIRQQTAPALEIYTAGSSESTILMQLHKDCGSVVSIVKYKCVLEIVCFLQFWNLFRIQLHYNCEVCSCAVFHGAILNCIFQIYVAIRHGKGNWQNISVQCSFFGRIEDTIIRFRDCLTFRRSSF